MFSARRDKHAAKRFLIKVLKAKHNQEPRVINVDKNPAYPPAIEELKKSRILSNECELRQQKYLNNIIEQDHRFTKKLAKYKLYFQFFHTAWRTLRGYEIMNVIRKGQIENISKGDILGQRDFIHSLFGITV
jgi:IS6 family transposase